MEAMDLQRVTIESFVRDALFDSTKTLVAKARDSRGWACVLILSLPFGFFAYLLFFILGPTVVCARLAVAHADRVVFVLASAILSFYQVPRKVFYIYMAVLAFTGFLQVLRYKSIIRLRFLGYLSFLSCGTSNRLLRKFTTLHFSNPFNRCFTTSHVIYVPIGFEVRPESYIEVFDFPIAEDLNFDKTVGSCRIKIETLGDIGTSTIRVFRVDAPWDGIVLQFTWKIII